MRVARLTFLVLVLLVLSGCAFPGYKDRYYGGPRPISPYPDFAIPTVDSLRPTFIWDAGDGRPVDLVIWNSDEEVARCRFFCKLLDYKPDMSNTVYLREEILGGKHRIESNLAPGTVYFWSARYRGEPWAQVQKCLGGNVGPIQTESMCNWRALYFAFRTPGSK